MYQATEHIVIGSDDSPGTADTGSHGGNLLGVWSVAVLSSGILMETEIFRKTSQVEVFNGPIHI